MKKNQVYISICFLFPLILSAQEKFKLHVNNEQNDAFYNLSLENFKDIIIDLNNNPSLENIEEFYDDTYFYNLEFNNTNRAENIIDVKSDSFHNLYKLIFEHTTLSIQKYSPEEILFWEYSFIGFDETQFIPKGIYLLNDDKIFIACYRINSSSKNSLALYCINSEGDLQNEIVFN